MTIRITQNIQSAYEIRSMDPKRWPPESRSSATSTTTEITRQWHNRRRANAALPPNRQLSRP